MKPVIGGSDGEGAPASGNPVATQPFVVGEGSVSVSVATIPGLKYALQRTDSLRRAEGVAPYQGWGAVGDPVIATGTSVTLTDDNPPVAKAFYRVGVSAP